MNTPVRKGQPPIQSAESRPCLTARRAFTLLEMLFVVGIIALLLGLVGGVGIVVLRNQKVAQTQNLLSTLDRALDEYITVVGAIPPYITSEYDKVPGENNDITTSTIPKFFDDYRGVPNNPVRPDAAVFLKRAMGVGEVQSIVQGIPSQFLVVTRGGDNGDLDQGDQDLTPSVVDSWATTNWGPDSDNNLWDITKQQVIYFVHPDNRLAQDLFGQCVNRRPYFFSAGPDLKYGLASEIPGGDQEQIEALLADNVYSYPVGPFNNTEMFFNNRRTRH